MKENIQAIFVYIAAIYRIARKRSNIHNFYTNRIFVPSLISTHWHNFSLQECVNRVRVNTGSDGDLDEDTRLDWAKSGFLVNGLSSENLTKPNPGKHHPFLSVCCLHVLHMRLLQVILYQWSSCWHGQLTSQVMCLPCPIIYHSWSCL